MQLDRTTRARLMPDLLRSSIYLGFGGVWLTGCVWLVLHLFFAVPGEFGIARHPLEPTMLWIHGALSIAIAYLSGWIMARHASEAWRQQKRRTSGGLLTAVLAVLSVSGFALFFITDSNWQTQSARIHEILGVAVTLFGFEHWRVANGRADTRRAPSKSC
jgi:hypothetical protein